MTDSPTRVTTRPSTTTFEFNGLKVATTSDCEGAQLPRIGESVELPAGDRYRVVDVVHAYEYGGSYHVTVHLE